MADFVLFYCSAYSGTANRGHFLYDDLTFYDTQVIPYDYHSAYNQNTGIVYVGNNSANQLQGVLGSNHTVQYTYNGNYRPLFVDKNGKVWCVASSADKYIYLFEADLSDVTTYTLKAGTPLAYLAPTFDSQYVYVMQSAFNGVLAKYGVSNLDGGDPEWSINVSYAKCIFCDEDNNVYVLTLSSLTKYSDTDGSQLWSISAGGYYGFYSLKTGMMYVPYDDDGKVLEVTTDGDVDGYADINYRKPSCVGGSYNSDIYFMISSYGIGSTNALYRYPHSDWDSPETEVNHKFWFVYNYWFAGDPAGYVNYVLRTYPVAGFSATPLSGNAPLSVTFTDSSTGNITDWSWDFGDGNTSTDQNPTNNYTTPGVYDVTLTVTTSEGWTDSETKTEYIYVTNATVITKLDELAVRLEDTEEHHFTKEIKLEAYCRSQDRIANFIKSEYAQSLLEIDSGIDISSGEYALSSLSYTVIQDGILGVKVTIDSTDYWAYEIPLKEVRRLNNPYYLPDYEVFYYINEGKLKFKTGDGLSLSSATADVYLLKVPTDMTTYVDTELPSSLKELLVTMAEYYCWDMEGNKERSRAIKNLAMKQIETMNYRFRAPSEIIMGG